MVDMRITSQAPRQRPGLLVRVVDGETVVLDRIQGLIHRLNGSASLIWDRCNGERGLSEMVAAVASAFHVDLETAERGVTAAVRRLAELGLLDGGDDVIAGESGNVQQPGRLDHE
jgi:hypothetical protein